MHFGNVLIKETFINKLFGNSLELAYLDFATIFLERPFLATVAPFITLYDSNFN